MTPEMIEKIVEAREILMDLTSEHWDDLKPWEANKLTTAELILAEVMGEHGEGGGISGGNGNAGNAKADF